MSIVSKTKKQILGEIQCNPNHGICVISKSWIAVVVHLPTFERITRDGSNKSRRKGKKKNYHLTEKEKMLSKSWMI